MNNPIIVERTFAVTPDRLWKALTDEKEIKQWYFNLPGFKAVVGYEFEFMGGKPKEKQYRHLCRITEVIPGRKIAYTWRYDGYEGDSLVTFELFPEKEKTRLRLTNEGIESFSAVEDLVRKNFEEGWASIVNQSLRKYLEEKVKR